MTPRDVVKGVLDNKRPPYVPWHMTFSAAARVKLTAHFGHGDIDREAGNHLLRLGSTLGFFEPAGEHRVRDQWGVVWDRSVDPSFGMVCEYPLRSPSFDGYAFPESPDPRFFADIERDIASAPDRFRMFNVGLALFERAWSLRGMENILVDLYDNPMFVHEMFDRIAACQTALVREALRHDIDAVFFMDDWGQQKGLIMGPVLWRKFILPVLRRMYGTVRDAGKYVVIHSCGDVDELYDDLIDAGVNCVHPVQPEVMDAPALIGAYRGRLAFYGGLSTQRVLPFGTPDDVKREVRMLLDAGRDGGYIFAPAQSIEGDVPLGNILALIETVRRES